MHRKSKLKLLVLGLDGADYHYIMSHLIQLPILNSLRIKYGLHLCECDVHGTSPSSWSTIFSGVHSKEHGIYDFYKPNAKEFTLYTRADYPFPFAWDKLSARGYDVAVYNAFITYPPFHLACEPPSLVEYDLSVKKEDILRSIDLNKKRILDLLYKKVEVIFATIAGIDRASHRWWGTDFLLTVYQAVDQAVFQILDAARNFLIISDHGFEAVSTLVRDGKLPPDNPAVTKGIPGGHDVDGISISNFTKVTKVTEAYDKYMKLFRF